MNLNQLELDNVLARRPTETAAKAAIKSWLDEHAPGHPEFSLCEDGGSDCAPNKCGWAFWIAPLDTTSYLNEDMTIEWYGTGWPNQFSYDEDTGDWVQVKSESRH